MPLIKVDEGDQYEDKPVSEGQYDLRVMKAENTKSKKGKKMLHVLFKIEGEEEASPVGVWILHPNEDETDSYRFRMRDMTRLAALLGMNEFDYEDNDQIADMVGKTCTATVNLEVDDETGDERNTVRLPKIRGSKR